MSKEFRLTMDIYKQYKIRQLKKDVKPAVQDSVTNTMKDPNVKTEEEVKEPAEQAPAPEAQPGSAEGETGE